MIVRFFIICFGEPLLRLQVDRLGSMRGLYMATLYYEGLYVTSYPIRNELELIGLCRSFRSEFELSDWAFMDLLLTGLVHLDVCRALDLRDATIDVPVEPETPLDDALYASIEWPEELVVEQLLVDVGMDWATPLSDPISWPGYGHVGNNFDEGGDFDRSGFGAYDVDFEVRVRDATFQVDEDGTTRMG